MKEIILITSTSCPDCARMKKTILDAIKTNNVQATVSEFDSEDEQAITMAIKYGINDLPGCNINGKPIYGKNFKNEDITCAIQKLT